MYIFVISKETGQKRMRTKEYIFMRLKVLDMKMHTESHLIDRKNMVYKSDEDYIALTLPHSFSPWTFFLFPQCF